MIDVLYIAEKASVGRALAEVLPGAKEKDKNHIKCGSSIVSWAAGHILALYEPDEYDDKYKSWALSSLPIIPAQWKLKEVERTKSLVAEIKKHLKEAKKVVNAGDADREGQLLIDEILEYCGWKGETLRLRINDVNPDAIRKALDGMKPNKNYEGEYKAGMARSRADWLVGMNLTRYCTVNYQNAGYEGNFSVGRVQTPTLGLVVKRDREIAGFVPKPYFEIYATLNIPAGNRQITGKWAPGEDFTNLDAEKRLVDRAACEALKEKLTDAEGKVLSMDKKMRKSVPPLPYSLAQLQIDASRKYDITETLPFAQTLYEQGYTTYPRSGCRYIPEGHHANASKILEAITAGCPSLQGMMKDVDATRKSPAWDDSKVTEHHAILPTTRVPAGNVLSENERKIYDLICARYIIQFLPDHEYRETTIEFESAGEKFKVSGREIVAPGWKNWGKEEDDEDQKEEKQLLPAVAVGETGTVKPRMDEKMTSPPKRFTHDGLISAMNSIYLYVDDPAAKKQLKELDGIGTSATQENIVNLLYQRGYMEKRKKQIYSTASGQSLIDVLNAGKTAMLVKPELTAFWEQKMTQIEKGALPLDTFVAEVASMVGDIVKSPLKIPEIQGAKRGEKCLTPGCEGYLRYITKGKSPFYSCPVCKATFNERDGKPVERTQSEGNMERIEADCPKGCGKKAVRLKGQYGFFWKCECFDGTFKDVDGKPVIKEERPKAKCPVKGCKGTAQQFQRKDGSGAFWKCTTCSNMFNDENGKPVIKDKPKDNKDKPKGK